ncbi:MAG TPA: 50S ribosomal protein L3 N(5)-glutamine methyltransferase [Burkholderiales bacterium]|nr:50S ribosomal protein L3 N(5)-glutamine methyltransferase [Burkholderiales bacterium]
MTLAQLIERTARRLESAPLFYGHGTDNARDEAAWLVLRGLGLPFGADLQQRVSDEERIESLLQRRIDERVPVAYLLKEAWLAGQSFYVDERVIVPRSHIAELLREKWLASHRARRILDLCTGSGCLAILAARAFASATVDAADVSPAALAVAGKNVARHRLGRRVKVRRSDLFAGLRGERYDLILSNPPYVSASAMAKLPAEYRHEPRLALVGGADGLDLVARMLAQAPDHLEAGGVLVCEIGDGKAAVQRRFPRLPLGWPRPEVFTFQPARKDAAARKPSSRAARAG